MFQGSLFIAQALHHLSAFGKSHKMQITYAYLLAQAEYSPVWHLSHAYLCHNSFHPLLSIHSFFAVLSTPGISGPGTERYYHTELQEEHLSS